jgi:N-acetylneuraminic acid mutarotase
MRKPLAVLLVALFLSSSCVIIGNPVSGTSVQENTWVEKASMHVARANLGLAVVDGIIYAIGGDEGADEGNASPGDTLTQHVVNDTEAYDPNLNRWTPKADMPTSRALFGTAVYQKRIYCIGGYYGASIFIGPETWNWKTEYYNSAKNEVFDCATNSWLTKAPMPTPCGKAAINIVNGKIYVIGGFTVENLGTTNNLNQVYDPQTDEWTIKSSAPLPIASSASAVVDNKIYVLGYKPSNQVVVEIYNPANDSWSIGKAEMTGHWATGAATSGVNALKRIYFFDYNRTDVYDPVADSWVSGSSPPTNRLIAKVAVVNDLFYLIGGRTGQWGYITMLYPTTLNEQYLPFGYGSPDPLYLLEITPPVIGITSPVTQTNNQTNVTLSFTIDKPFSLASYSLDGKDNITVTGNVTLSELSYGLHNVTFYAKDTFGNVGKSETISFTVTKPEIETFPIVAIGVVLVVAVIGIGLLVYFKKHKRIGTL